MLNRFNFINLSPTPGLVGYSTTALERVEDLAPYESRTDAVLTRLLKGYLCALEIHASDGLISTQAFAETAEQAIRRAGAQILKKLEIWKENRFAPDELFDPRERSPPLADQTPEAA